MAEQDWPNPYPVADGPLQGALPPAIARYELRPLSVGEILDRIFSLYRTHFWFFVGLSAISAGVSSGIAVLRLIFLHFSGITVTTPAFALINVGLSLVQLVLYLIAYSLTLAATTSAVHFLYLGQPTSFQIALTRARSVWLRCLGIAFWQAWSACWISVIMVLPFALVPGIRGAAAAVLAVFLGFGFLASLIYGVIAYLRNSLAVPVAVVEDLRVRAAMRRSKQLATGRVGRIFLLILLVYALWVVAALIQAPLAVLLVVNHSAERFVLQALVLAVNFVTTSLVGPVAAIGLCLFYFDERVRREGFDIEMLLHGVAMPPPSIPLPPPPAILTDGPTAPHQTSEQM